MINGGGGSDARQDEKHLLVGLGDRSHRGSCFLRPRQRREHVNWAAMTGPWWQRVRSGATAACDGE